MRHQRTIFEQGTLVWGHLVQANQDLFDYGKDNLPADLVFSLDESNNFSVEELAVVAQRVFDLKNTEPEDDRLGFLASHLSDETERACGLRIPDSLSPNFECRLSTTYFVRKHLPGGQILDSLMPILVIPEKPYLALPLPERYWSADEFENEDFD